MNESDERLAAALRSIFVPLANLLLKNKIGAEPAIQQLRLAFVTAARANHSLSERPASINRISNITGFSRAHVENLLGALSDASRVKAPANPKESRVLSAWLLRNEHTDSDGNPKTLSGGRGPGSLFDLVCETIGEQDAKTTIDGLISAGSIKSTDDGRFELSNRLFSISNDLPRLLAVGLSSLAHTLDRNWDYPAKDAFAQRTAHTLNLDPDKFSVVRRIAKNRVEKMLEEIDDILSSYEVSDDDIESAYGGPGGPRVGVGAYYFEVFPPDTENE